ncbi:hypothetical protein AB0N97_01665 [Streptomyces collinus]|uniref:hypothetical protein n=1 Tax=Streptomyces collinus TaxID=42684 RepID=UPI003444B950
MPAVVVCLAGMRLAAVPQAELRGGSTYVTYRVDGDCTREPYGVVNSYDHAAELIGDRLAQLTRAGQRRLRIPVFHHRGADIGMPEYRGPTTAAPARGRCTWAAPPLSR